MAILDDIKLALRIDDTALDTDIQDTIDAAMADLELNGVVPSKIVTTDAIILRAVKTYCKAEYSYDPKENDRYMQSYDLMKNHLALSQDYAYCAITIKIGSQGTVIFNDESKQTNNSGDVIFYSKPKNHVEYIVNGKSYFADVTADATITVT